MSDINDGGPAFPALEPHYMIDGPKQHYTAGGMTLRDYFAAKAMQVACEAYREGHPDGFLGVARYAYAYAYAMLKARAA